LAYFSTPLREGIAFAYGTVYIGGMKTVQTMLSSLNEAGLTDAQVADHCGVSQATVNRLRHGVHAKTDYETYAAIEALYKRNQRKSKRAA
jgi:IS30 family transposase